MCQTPFYSNGPYRSWVNLKSHKERSGFPSASVVKNAPEMQEMQKTRVWSLGQEDPLEKEMATHCSILAWTIPWTERSLAGYSPLGSKEWNTTEDTHAHTYLIDFMLLLMEKRHDIVCLTSHTHTHTQQRNKNQKYSQPQLNPVSTWSQVWPGPTQKNLGLLSKPTIHNLTVSLLCLHKLQRTPIARRTKSQWQSLPLLATSPITPHLSFHAPARLLNTRNSPYRFCIELSLCLKLSFFLPSLPGKVLENFHSACRSPIPLPSRSLSGPGWVSPWRRPWLGSDSAQSSRFGFSSVPSRRTWNRRGPSTRRWAARKFAARTSAAQWL